MSRVWSGVLAIVACVATINTTKAEEPANPAQGGSVTAFINQQIAAKWKEAEIKPAVRSTDSDFIRRVFIDLIGRVATPEEVIDFDNDKSSDKRAKLVKRLLYATDYKPKVGGQPVMVVGSDGKKHPLTFDYADEYATHWSNIWTVWLMSRTGDGRYREQMKVWLTKAFLDNKSHKDMVVELITATGKTNENGAVNFIVHQMGDENPAAKRGELGRFDAVPITSRVTRLFLGLQTQCTQCHDHPFNKEWVQADFWGVNAYFRQVNLLNNNGQPTQPTRPNDNRQMMQTLNVVNLVDQADQNASGRLFYDRRDGKLMAAKPNFLKDVAQAEKGEPSNKSMTSLAESEGKTRRQVLAQYVISHDNFNKAYVNRIWGHLFGRGLNKEPSIDDFGSNNEVVHPELLARLGEDFAKYGHNPKMLLEWICNSDAYSLSHVASKEYIDQKYDPYFARMPLKALSPEVLFESIMTATRAESSANSEGRKNLRERWMSRLVQQFGDDEGNEMTFNGTVVQALLMMNGRELNEEIGPKGTNVIGKLVEKHSKSGQVNVDGIFDEMFLLTLNRRPTGDERTKLKNLQMKGAMVKLDGPAPAVPAPMPKGPQPKGPNKGPKTPAAPSVPGWSAPAKGPGDVEFYQDVFWALLNTNEFMLNH
jgi:hypothetical protein